MPLKFLKKVIYEDKLPENMSYSDYSEWYGLSWIDYVRVGWDFERSSMEIVDRRVNQTTNVEKDLSPEKNVSIIAT